MYISDFSLHDFRSYKETVLHFEPGVTAFVGENGQGKTNIVEGIEYLATFSSHRVNADAALVRQGAQAAVVRARVNNEARSSVVEIEICAGRANRARLNRGNVKPSDLLGCVRTVVFSPEDLGLVTADPSTRRRFLDVLMIQHTPRMRAVKADYEKVLRQRAALLKTLGKQRRRGMQIDDSVLDVWDVQVAQLGAQIVAHRALLIEKLRPHVESYYTQVSGAQSVARIDYDANINASLGWELPAIENMGIAEQTENTGVFAYIAEHERELQDSGATRQSLLQALKRGRKRDIDSGLNLIGPHRDDVRLALGTLPAKGYASHGESWSYALALRLASWQVLKTAQWAGWEDGDQPILILDDVFAELDSRRRERLVSMIAPAQQVFITAAVGDDLPENLDAHRFFVHNGRVSSDHNE